MKKLNPKQKKILDIVLTAVQIAVVIIAITISAIVIANPIVSSAEVGSGNIKLLPVLTDSMDGNHKDSFKPGDLVIASKPKNVRTLQKDDIITYVGPVNGIDALITHRIVDIVYESEGIANTYYTVGDKYETVDEAKAVNPNEVLAVYKYHLKGVGNAINWLQDDTNFLLVIVLPLAVLFVYNIIVFVRMLMQGKLDRLREESAQGTNAIDEEEIKRKAIEEYLASKNAAPPADGEDKKE